MSVRLGELLVERGVLDAEQLAEALEDQQVTGRVLGKILIAKGFATETEVMRTLAEQAGRPFVELSEAPLDPAALAMEWATLARMHPGRVIGGIGHGVPGWMRQVSPHVESPLTLLRETIEQGVARL